MWQKYFLKTLTDVFYELLVILPKFIKFLTHHESCITFLKITEKVLKKKTNKLIDLRKSKRNGTNFPIAIFNPERNLFSVYMIPEGNFTPE